MLVEERKRRQDQLEKCIYEMSQGMLGGEPEVRKMSLKLLEVYRSDFRHNYAGFFPVILNISKDQNKYSLDFLSENIETLRNFLEDDYVSGEKEFSDLYTHIDKLCDHLNLEIGRLNYYSINDNKIKDIESKTNELNYDLRKATNDLNKASKKAETIQTELIAVLSIFAAIVITFSGGVSFLGSAMTSINNAKYYEAVVLVAIICGLVIFNTIFLMMYLVSKIIDRNIYARCISTDCFACEESECRGITKIKKRLPYVFYFNALCIVGITIDMIVWAIDIAGMI